MECDGVIGMLFFHTLGITHLLEKANNHLKDLREKQFILLKYCPSEHMVADILIKNLSTFKHAKFMNKMKLYSNEHTH